MNLIQLTSEPMKELLTPGGEHHGISDGDVLVITKIEDPPLWSPKRTPDLASRWRTGGDGGSILWIVIILSPWFFSRKIWFYSVGFRVRGATRWGQPTWARLGGRRALVGCAHPGAPLRYLLAPEILFIGIKILAKFNSIPRTFISAEKPHRGSSAENSISPGLVSFKSCKLESKTRGKALGKVDTLETYQLPQA